MQRNSPKTVTDKISVSKHKKRLIIEDITATLLYLQLNLIEQSNIETEVRMELQGHETNVNHLQDCLKKEKLRNDRLMELLRGVDSSPEEDSPRTDLNNRGSVTQSINPILLQYKWDLVVFGSLNNDVSSSYEELSTTYKKCLKQLSKKDKQMRSAMHEREMLMSKYDLLYEKYKYLQKQLEELCCKYLHLQSRKNEEIFKLRAFIMESMCGNRNFQ